jgi:predicted glutamine amidotransferase
MCGIVGMVMKTATGFTKVSEDIFDQLLYANTLRGDDSTGVIAIEKDTTFHIVKDASPAWWFTEQFRKTTVSRDMWSRGKAIIGHNRKKTIGAVSDTTAHPFVINDEFAMVHNGTLYNHRLLADTEVDSQALATVLADAFKEDNYQEALEETLGRVSGAYAVAIYDQRHNKVRLLRNRERPLCLVDTPTATYFASESGMLLWILQRNSVPLKDVQIESVPEHVVLDLCLDTNTIERTPITPKKILPPVTTTHTKAGGKTNTMGGINFKKYTETEGLSKNKFKRFRNKFLGKKVNWWCEDYIEENFPKSEIDGETSFVITGVSDTFDEDHLIKAIVDIKELNLYNGKALTDRLWSGTIMDMSYEKRAKRILIHLDKCIPVPVSMKPRDAVPGLHEYDAIESTYIGGVPHRLYYKGTKLIAKIPYKDLYEDKETVSLVH